MFDGNLRDVLRRQAAVRKKFEFAWAVLVSTNKLARLIIFSPSGSQGHELGWLLLVTGLWYLGWCQGCVSLLGAIRPESVIFFACLGLLAAATHLERDSQRLRESTSDR